MRHSAGTLEVPLLIDALDDPDQKVARGASSALWDITGKRVCDAQELRENLPFCVESWQQWAHRDPTKRSAVSSRSGRSFGSGGTP